METVYSTTQLIWIIILAIFTKESLALRDIRVKVPQTVRRGQKITLHCHYDLEDDTLYSVKWYKKRSEFYNYTPNEKTAIKVFQTPGVRVDRSSSNATQLVLESASMATAGEYSCEVSADAPSFHTLIAAAELEVVEFPHYPPVIIGIRPRYHIGDILRGNCTSRHSKPAANLTWTVNNEEIQPSHVRHYKIRRDARNDMQTSIIGLHFVINDYHFVEGKLKIRCIAQIGDIYYKSTEKTVLDEHHHKYLGTNTVNMIPTDRDYDQYALQDSEMLRKKNNYLTQIQDFFYNFIPSNNAEISAWASDSNASSTPSFRLMSCCLNFLIAYIFCACWNLYNCFLNLS